ncbi:unnamed protein product [marine sediment metagenome]|uniref:Uncharacterized protein n=1 Tax=marine sediment metagenome TaxID=412755 RepID=X0T8X4_9ZZZZ
MKRNSQSSNTNRAADEKAERISKAKELEKMCQDREAERVASPDWTAEIVQQDDKTEVIKWRRTDELNAKLF